ncbi:MAG: NADH-quinone oxidoreductase subunit C [Coriobacteriales bacterium]|jgi:hypothetical protein|nr:NADH-quinone oxidoreductase subunit C [Coriobacteriales bacterium]
MNPQVFKDIEPAQMRAEVESYHSRGWRFVQICGSTLPEGVELLYSFSDGEPLENLRMVVDNGSELPSISDLYLNAFFFENETHDLFGVSFKGIAIDFGGEFYTVSVPTPMNPASAQAADFLAAGAGDTSDVAGSGDNEAAPDAAGAADTTPTTNDNPGGEL